MSLRDDYENMLSLADDVYASIRTGGGQIAAVAANAGADVEDTSAIRNGLPRPIVRHRVGNLIYTRHRMHMHIVRPLPCNGAYAM